MDRENSCEGMQLLAPKTKQINLIFFWLPRTGTGLGQGKGLGRALQWDSLAPSPITDITPLPRPTASGRFVPPGCPSGSVTGAEINGTGPDGCLPELDMFPPVAKLCVYGICAFVLRCFFLFSHCTPQMEHSLGVIFFFSSSLSSCNAVFFFHSLSSCSVYPVVICMLCMYGQVDG